MRVQTVSQAPAAGLLDRAGAYLVDSLVTGGLWASAVLVLSGGSLYPSQWSPATTQIASMLFLVVPFAYFVLLEGTFATTPGKGLFGLTVVGDEQGKRAGLYKATVRNVLRLAWALGPLGPLFLILDAVLVQWTERDTRLGDHAAGTRVLRTGTPMFSGSAGGSRSRTAS